MAREPAFQIIQTDVERWSVVTGYLRNPGGRLLKKAAGIEGAEIEDLPLYEAQQLCDLLNQ